MRWLEVRCCAILTLKLLGLSKESTFITHTHTHIRTGIGMNVDLLPVCLNMLLGCARVQHRVCPQYYLHIVLLLTLVMHLH